MTKQELKNVLAADLVRFKSRKPNVLDWIVQNEVYYIYHYIRHMRYVEYYQNKKGISKLLYFWHFLKYKRLGFKLHFTIYPGTIGAGFRIYHVGGFTHVGRNVSIGKNCTMQPGVVFGNKTEDEDNRQVIVGDNCYIGLNAKILGPIKIGHNVTIGANAVVTKDIPDNVVVGGVPAIILKYKNNV
ncbi:MAG: serine acetyltransferase [Bacteroidales bacterium]|jgi:serine O-acetyltransferase|nr:serine acetyltransferase [Bacteroidales bacterium]